MEAGEDFAEAGEFTAYFEEPAQHLIPTDSTKWPFFLYIGAQTFGDLAPIPTGRRSEFEALALKVKPAHVWLGLLVEYN
jgi:hypothetical protein